MSRHVKASQGLHQWW